MKTFVALAVSIVLVGILFCPMVRATPPMPADVQMVQPDLSLPKELAAFWGNWEGTSSVQYFVIVEKIDEEKASLYIWQSQTGEGGGAGWVRRELKVTKEYGKYKLWYHSRYGIVEYYLKGKFLDVSTPGGILRLRQVQ